MKKNNLAIFTVLASILSICAQAAVAADIQVAWDAVNSTALAGYNVYYGTASRNYGTPLKAGTSTGYTISGLQAGIYYIAVTAYDSTGKETGYSNEATATITPNVTSVAATIVGSTSATVAWQTSLPSSSQTFYGLDTKYGSQTPLDSAQVTSHAQNLTGLAAGTTYHFQVQSSQNGVSSTSGDNTFTTVADSPPPSPSLAISAGPSASGITTSGATISWTTNLAADSKVYYGTDTAYGSTAQNSTQDTSHIVNLSGLAAGTTYHCQVSSSASGATATSADYAFTTAAAPPPPSSSVVISGVTTSRVTSSGATITWTTNVPTDTKLQYKAASDATYTDALGSSSNSGLTHSVTLTSLNAKTTYYYQIIATATTTVSVTAATATATSTQYSFRTAPPTSKRK